MDLARNSLHPLTHAQLCPVTFDRVHPDTSGCSLCASVRCGDVDLSLLAEAINATLARNEGLRIRVVEVEAGPEKLLRQYFHPFFPRQLETVDFSAHADPEKAFREWVGHVVDEPQRLLSGELIDFTLLSFGPGVRGYFVKAHRVLADEVTVELLVRQVHETYRTLAAGEAPSGDERPGYARFIEAEREYFASPARIAHRDRWIRRLSPLPPEARFTNRQSPQEISRARSRRMDLGPGRARNLTGFCARGGLAPAEAISAALAVYLARVNDLTDLAVTVVHNGRPAPALADVMGLCSTLLPVRVKADEQRSFAELARSFAVELRSAGSAAGRYPWALLAEDLRTAFDGNGGYLADIQVVALGPAPVPYELHTPSFEEVPLTLYVHPLTGDGELTLLLSYRTDLFGEDDIDTISRSLVHLLDQALAGPDRPLGELALVDPVERRRLLEDFNRTDPEYDTQTQLHCLFEEQVVRAPDKAAVVFGDRVLTYRELNERANRLARLLRRKGAAPDVPVGILMERGLDIFVAMLAVLKSGAAYIPIDVQYPAERIRNIMDTAGGALLLTQGSLAAALTIEGEVVLVDSDPIEGDGSNLEPVGKPDDLAVIIFTSGSTGQPKGVMLEHRALVDFARFFVRTRELTPADNVAKHASFSFDASLMETYPALAAGSTIHVVPEEIRLDLERLNRFYEDRKVTVAFFTTQLGEQFAALTDNRSLRVALVGGEKLRSFRPRAYQFQNLYGPTEASVFCTELTVKRSRSNIPIGKPRLGMKIFILDKKQRLVPVGVAGELCISGTGVARGYIGRPDLTAERFVDNPYLPGRKMYRTGDITRWLPDGNIEYVGRTDFQVKIRGFRIEIGEIESRMLAYPGVSAVIVVDRDDPSGNKSLCGYFVAERSVEEPALRSFLKKELAEFMVPAFLVQLDQMPLTPNGKVDRRALPIPQIRRETVAPATPTEHAVLGVWKEVLGLSEAGVTESFFDVGGHSLKATILQARLNHQFQTSLTLPDVFAHPTVVELARAIDGRSSPGRGAIPRLPDGPSYPVSGAQKRMFLMEQLSGLGTTYNLPTIVQLDGPLDPARLVASLDRLVARHESLRTSFCLVDGEPVQVVHPALRFKKPYRECDERDLGAVLDGFVRPFDLTTPPLFRVLLVKTARERHHLLLDIHHSVFDGASLDVLVNDLMALYQGRDLPPLRVQYRDFADWHNRRLAGEECGRLETFWLDRLSGEIPVLEMPTDFPRPPVLDYVGDTVSGTVDATATDRLRKLAAASGTTLYTVLMAAYTILMSRYASQEDVVIGTLMAGRDDVDTQGMMGMFVNTVPIRTRPRYEAQFTDYLAEVKTAVLDAFAHQDYPLDRLVEKLRIHRDPSRSPLFDVGFVLQNFELPELGAEGLTVRLTLPERKNAMFDLFLDVFEVEDRLELKWEYRTSLFTRRTITGLSSHFVNLLASIVDRPQRMLKELKLLTPAEEHLQIYAFNATPHEIDPEVTLQELFERQVARTPDRPAVVYHGQSVTYAQLDRMADRIARRLVELGAGPETVVGLMADRSIEIIAATLAILKSGSAAMPIDCRYPPDRVRYMLEDSGASILVTHRHLAQDLGFGGARIDLDDPALCEVADGPVANRNHPANMAYVIYTSGSTGKPKGVVIDHRAIAGYCLGCIATGRITGEDRIAKHGSFSFDASIEETLPGLFAGAVLYLVPEELRLDVVKLNEYFEQNSISFVFFTTQLGEQFMDLVDNRSLRVLEVGGEKLKTFQKRRYALRNTYGPTETTVDIATFVVDREYSNIPIGKPVPNALIQIVDRSGNLCPVNVPGELCVSGSCLARGYLNRPDLTAQKFVDSPFLNGQKMYRTGDIARWLPDGNIEFVGRTDFQVKIRGFRIEIGEIEAQILKFKEIREVTVLDRTDGAGNTYLCGYFTARSPVDQDVLKAFIRKDLADFMVPARLVQLAAMPLTPHGKVDRLALPEPGVEAPSGERVPPADETERSILESFRKVLKTEAVGVTDDFFELGGHSLKAVALTAEIQKQFEVTVNDVFTCKTVRKLARIVRGKSTAQEIKRESIKRFTREKGRVAARFLDSGEGRAIVAAYQERNDALARIDPGPAASYGEILLTGATGYLGVHLLRALLESGTARITLPVRAPTAAAALARLREKTAYYFGDRFLDLHGNRIVVVPSDLALPGLGLPDDTYADLTRRVECVIHSAALVKHYGDYAGFESANVEATRRLLEFAREGRAKDFHQVSTISVLEGSIAGCPHMVFTEDDLDRGQTSSNNYLKTKLAAERLVAAARSTGVRTTIHRVGNIAFDSVSGCLQDNIEDNGFFQTVKAYINVGLVPTVEDEVELSFVDALSRAVVALVDRPALGGATYHLCNSHVVKLSELLCSPELSLGVTAIAFDRFIDRVFELSTLPHFDEPVRNLLLHGGWMDDLSTEATRTTATILSERTDRVLRRLGFEWPRLEPSRLRRMIVRALADRIAFLRKTPLFSGLPAADLEAVAPLATLRHVPVGKDILWEGESNEAVHVLLDGHLEIGKNAHGGWYGVIGVMSPGEVVGEDSLILSGPSSVTAESILDDAYVLSFDAGKLRAMLEENPRLTLAFLGAVERRVRKLEQLFVSVA